MLPHDITPETIPLPDGERRSAVFFSGSGIRHRRLGYLIQQRYPGLLKAWWVFAPSSSKRYQAKLEKAWHLVKNSQTSGEAVELARSGDVASLVSMARRQLKRVKPRRVGTLLKRYVGRNDYATIEQEMFGAELQRLEANAELHPENIDNPNRKARVERLRELDPYLILTFGGPLLSGRVLRSARGVAINQHAGWSPSIKGASTTETAIYHRELGWVGNTVHLMDTHADAGPILRRSTATLHPDDDLAHCFFAVCAVGSKMMLETIETALHADELTVHPQRPGGKTVLNIDFTATKREAIARDLDHGWLGDALRMTCDF